MSICVYTAEAGAAQCRCRKDCRENYRKRCRKYRKDCMKNCQRNWRKKYSKNRKEAKEQLGSLLIRIQSAICSITTRLHAGFYSNYAIKLWQKWFSVTVTPSKKDKKNVITSGLQGKRPVNTLVNLQFVITIVGPLVNPGDNMMHHSGSGNAIMAILSR